MNKAYSIFLTGLFSLFIGGILVGSLLLPDRTFSPMENRNLAKPPKLSWENVESGKFMSDAESYVNDQIMGRDFWVAMKAWSERLSGKQENNGIYFAGARSAPPSEGNADEGTLPPPPAGDLQDLDDDGELPF